ncbi:MAG: LLM class flavin-dependent oxidoreductase [Proteobacteria bacterium]|nr:LLM class flavin-dependent oxidoreductase [Pseudomonadota bacterium]
MFGVALDGRETPAEARAFAMRAETAGARSLWISCHLFQREPAIVGALALGATRRVGATLMAISPYVVHPVYAAMAAATLDEYFPGRVALCLGVGAPKDLEAAGIVARRLPGRALSPGRTPAHQRAARDPDLARGIGPQDARARRRSGRRRADQRRHGAGVRALVARPRVPRRTDRRPPGAQGEPGLRVGRARRTRRP